MQNKTFRRFLAVEAILLYWVVYYWQDYLAGLGDYRVFSYSFHELYSSGILLVPVLTIVWLVALTAKTKKEGAWRKNALLLTLLVVLSAGQLLCLTRETANTVKVSGVKTVLEIPNEYHIVVESGNRRVTLETNPQVTKLLKTDGTEYLVVYDQRYFGADTGKLEYIELTENSLDNS